jgi:GAF domain-containing protein
MATTSNSDLIERVRAIAATPAPPEDVLRQTVELLRQNKPAWNWVGVYILVGDVLLIGPYVGKPTDHVRIEVGVGVCGTAVAENSNIIVDDVRARDNYLACSLETRSEVVVLIRDGYEVLGQFDIDSDEVATFRQDDEALLEALAQIVLPQTRALRDAMALQESAAAV